MGKLFNLDNPVMQGLSRLADMMILNLLVLLLCIPVVTAGSALSSMYYVELKWVRKEEGYVVKPFFRQFKDNFVQATVEWLFMLAVIVVLAMDFWMFRQSPDAFPKLIKYLVGGVSVTLYLLLIWVFPLQSHFVNKVGRTIKNSMLIAIANFPRTLGIGLVWIGAAVLLVISLVAVPLLFPIMLLFGFTVPGYLTCLLVSKPFARFEPEEKPAVSSESEEEVEDAYRYLNEKLGKNPAPAPALDNVPMEEEEK